MNQPVLLFKELKELKGRDGKFNRPGLKAFLDKYAGQVAAEQDMFPEEGAWPVLKAIRLLENEEELDLVQAVLELYKERNLPSDERLVLLLKDEDGNIKGVQGRSLNNTSQLRYITCMLTDDNKIFGLEHIDKTKTVYVTEGAFDSLFLDNAISVNGGDANVLTTATSIPQENLILVFDNEPRHKDTTKRLESAINKNYRVVIWDKIGTELKDINDMVKSGITIDYIKNYIDENNYRGTKALIKFKHWKK
jgi:hypothetical protein